MTNGTISRRSIGTAIFTFFKYMICHGHCPSLFKDPISSAIVTIQLSSSCQGNRHGWWNHFLKIYCYGCCHNFSRLDCHGYCYHVLWSNPIKLQFSRQFPWLMVPFFEDLLSWLSSQFLEIWLPWLLRYFFYDPISPIVATLLLSSSSRGNRHYWWNHFSKIYCLGYCYHSAMIRSL